MTDIFDDMFDETEALVNIDNLTGKQLSDLVRALRNVEKQIEDAETAIRKGALCDLESQEQADDKGHEASQNRHVVKKKVIQKKTKKKTRQKKKGNTRGTKTR